MKSSSLEGSHEENIDLCLQLQPSDNGVINDLVEPVERMLHGLARSQFHLILDSKFISSKMSTANLQNSEGIVHRFHKDLGPQLLDGLKVMPPVSDLGSLLLQVVPDLDSSL